MSWKHLSRKEREELAAALAEREIRQERKRQEAEGGLIEFTRYFWDVLEPTTQFVEGEVLFAICDHLEAVARGEINRLLINVPPGFMKSLLTNVFFPAWMWAACDKASTRFLTFSYAAHLTERDNGRFRDLCRSQKFQRMWGHRVTLSEEGKIKVSNTATGWKFASSEGGVGTGERGDIVIADDLNNVKDTESEKVYPETARWFREGMQNRLNDLERGAIIVIAQRTHEGDVSGVILEEYPEYVHLCIPMEFEADRRCETELGWSDWRTEDGELAWPERFPEEVLRSFKQYPYLWAGQYQQRPEPRGGGIIKREWWQLWEDEKYPIFDFIIGYVDTAFTEKEENDACAMTIWGVFTQAVVAHDNSNLVRIGSQTVRTYGSMHPKVMLIHGWEDKLEFHALLKKVRQSAVDYKLDQLHIENKANGITLGQEIKRVYASDDYGVILSDPGAQDKVSRLYAVQHLFTEGMIYAPDRTWADLVITRVTNFPKAKRKDVVDTVSGALTYLRRTGMLQRSTEIQSDVEREMRHYGKGPKPLYPV